MNKIEIKTIPAHIVYKAEYDQSGIGSFFDRKKDINKLYDLQYLMEKENPEVHVPDIGDDYNYFEYPMKKNEDGTVHIIYRDMIDKMGKDNADGFYSFEEVPEAEVAAFEYKGYYDSVGAGFDELEAWIEENGYAMAGPGRISAIHGSWDTENKDDYVNELQMPIAKAEMVLVNGKVFSVLEDDSIVRGQAIAVSNGKILKIGTDEEIKALITDKTEVIDCHGNTILPGMCDAHCHPSSVCGFIEACDLFGIYVSDEITPEDAIEIYMQKLKGYIEQHPEKELIRGAGWVLTNFTATGGRMPDRHDIDKICSDRPVVLDSFCGHNTWMNTKALEVAGLDENTPDTDTGTIIREENNYPSGLFLDAAANILAKTSVPGYALTKEEYLSGFRIYQYEFANRYGVTMVMDALAFDHVLDAYKELAEADELTLRLRGVAPLTPERYAEEIVEHIRDKGIYNVGEDFRVDTVKAFEDGPFAMKEPYRDEFCDETGIPRGSNAELLWDNEILTDTSAKAMEAGFAVHIHAMGDAAIEQSARCIADAQKRAGKDNTRSTITHLMLVSEEAADIMADANIIANVQPRWMNRDGDVEAVVHMAGPEKGERSYPFRTFTERGIKYAAGTDFPVTPPPSTMHEIHCWMNRSCFPGGPEYETWHGRVLGTETPATLAEAVKGLTWGGAYQMRMEDYTGTIEVGKSADFAILDSDIENTPKEDIYAVNVSKTVFKGKVVFEL